MGGCISSQLERQNDKKKVDFPSYQRYRSYGKQCLEEKNSDAADRSLIYRMANTSPDELKKLRKEWHDNGSCLKIVERFCKERSKKICLAYRNLVEIEKNKVTDKFGKEKTMETYVFDTKRQTMSYDLFWDNIISFGRGLTEIGLKKGSVVSIYEETRWQWLNTMYSCWSQGLIVSTVYANLGEAALKYALQETDCDAIVCNGSNVQKVVEMFVAIGSKAKIIYLDQLPAGVVLNGFEAYRWGDVMHTGKGSSASYKVPDGSAANETALIMYTSGTTGNPKGVVHTHGSLYCGVMTISQRVEDILDPIGDTEEWYCSYLPLAHIMEFAVSSVLMMRGTIVGYGSPRTLMDQFAKPHGDLTEYRPTVVVAVPRVFDTMKKAVESRLPKTGTLKRQIFDNAYRARLAALKEGKDTPYYNERVFSTPRSVMGGNVFAMLSGGGPISEATQEFINVVFGMVVQGWGLTETVCVGGIQRTGNLAYGEVGQILKTEEVQLRDTEQFKHTDKPEPRGEVCLRGPFLFSSYYKQPELTKEALDSEGWFHTGDVGAITSAGTIRLVGRVKALAKNANGEYLALETLESIYGTNEMCTPNCVCVLVNPHRSYITLLACTTEHLVDDFKRKYKLAGTFPEILTDSNFHKKVVQSFQKSARDAGLKSFEVVRDVKVVTDEWTPANVLTAALKLRRSVIDEQYKKDIDELFADDS